MIALEYILRNIKVKDYEYFNEYWYLQITLQKNFY